MSHAIVSSFEEAVSTAFKDTLCSQIWLGHGDALFIGFGTEVLPHHIDRTPHPIPLYELQTNFSNWTIKSINDNDENNTDYSHSIKMASILLGKHVFSWQFNGSYTKLTVLFESNLSLDIVGWDIEDVDNDLKDSDAWSIKIANGTHYSVSCNGGISFEDNDVYPIM